LVIKKKAEFLDVTAGGTYIYHWYLNGTCVITDRKCRIITSETISWTLK